MEVMWPPLRTCVLIFLLQWGAFSNPDDNLPVYLRGMNWSNVQEHLKDDLRLPYSIIPIRYEIDLFVNVRGHAGAEKSDFKGTVTIYLNLTKTADKIELHSNGLIIEKVKMVGSESLIEVTATNITSNYDRETVTIHTSREIYSFEKNFMIQISYRGVAKMDGYGLYENWDPKYNKSLDSNGPFILATNNVPTGARHWFPCFDEPHKRATFKVKVNHPAGMNVYSNADYEPRRITHNDADGNAKRVILGFEETGLLSTYQVSLSVNHLSSEFLDVNGFGEVRLIRSLNSHDFRRDYPNFPADDPAFPPRFSNDIPSLLKNVLTELNNLRFGEISKDKLDIIILEGTNSINIQPGLITIGRSCLWERNYESNLPQLAQLRVVNSIFASTPNLMLLNDMFTHFSTNETTNEHQKYVNMHPSMLESSLHEEPLRNAISHSSSTKRYLASRQELPALKAAQLLKLLIRYCPESKDVLQNIFASRNEKLAEIDYFIEEMARNCHDRYGAREFLASFINQPGKVFLTVKRTNSSVVIEQTRYQYSYFDSDLRDNTTRYTIPLYFTIDGEYFVQMLRKGAALDLTVPEASNFVIDHHYEHLYFVYYKDVMVPQKNITEHELSRTVVGLQKSMIAAMHIGYAKYRQIVQQMIEYVKMNYFDETHFYQVNEAANVMINSVVALAEYSEEQWDFYNCKDWYGNHTDWNGSFNNEDMYWRNPTDLGDLSLHMTCLQEWSSANEHRSFLEENFFGENTVIRPMAMSKLAIRDYYNQWNDLHRLFFRNAANFTNHRFDLLADVVLNQARLSVGIVFSDYPQPNMWDDYVKELRNFVMKNPRRAASMATEIEMRLEREFIRRDRAKWHNETRETMRNDLMLVWRMIEELKQSKE